MAFPFFKTKKIAEKKFKPKKSAVPVREKKEAPKINPSVSFRSSTPRLRLEEIDGEKSRTIKKEVKFGGAFRVLKYPHVTEKATDLTASNQYVFKIYPRANKTDVKKAIEKVFGVDVTGVRVINIPKKKRRLGKIKGFKEGYKKAIVKIKEGQKIEVLSR